MSRWDGHSSAMEHPGVGEFRRDEPHVYLAPTKLRARETTSFRDWKDPIALNAKCRCGETYGAHRNTDSACPTDTGFEAFAEFEAA